MKGDYCVYKHTDPEGKIYIGITCQSSEKRWNHGRGYYGQWFYMSIEKHGWENINSEILKSGLTKTEAEKMEIELIRNVYHSYIPSVGYNDTLGGKYRAKCNPVRCIEKHVVFPFASEMARYLGFDYQSGISECCRSGLGLHKGFHFEAALTVKEGDVFPL